MPIDSEPIRIGKPAPDDLTSIMIDIVSNVQWKFMGLMIIIFIFLNSDIFINRILSTFSGAVNYKYATSYGVVLQGIFLVIIMICIDVLVRQNVI